MISMDRGNIHLFPPHLLSLFCLIALIIMIFYLMLGCHNVMLQKCWECFHTSVQIVCWAVFHYKATAVIAHPCGRQSWSLFRRTTPERRRLDRTRWSWTTRSDSSSCGTTRPHHPLPPSCAAGCRWDSDSVNCSCIWTEATCCHHCWQSRPRWGHQPASPAHSCGKMTCQSLTGW